MSPTRWQKHCADPMTSLGYLPGARTRDQRAYPVSSMEGTDADVTVLDSAATLPGEAAVGASLALFARSRGAGVVGSTR